MELCSHIDENSRKKFEDMFLVKMASKGTSLHFFQGREDCDQFRIANGMSPLLRHHNGHRSNTTRTRAASLTLNALASPLWTLVKIKETHTFENSGFCKRLYCRTVCLFLSSVGNDYICVV